MKRAAALMLTVLLALVGGAADNPYDRPATRPTERSPRFAAVNVYIDPRGQPLAAYQFELTSQGGEVKLVGVEGGEHPAFADPPYYDPKANLHNRIVIAAFNTGDDLPRNRTKVATVMVQVSGNASWSAKLDVAGSPNANHIEAGISVSEGVAQ